MIPVQPLSIANWGHVTGPCFEPQPTRPARTLALIPTSRGGSHVTHSLGFSRKGKKQWCTAPSFFSSPIVIGKAFLKISIPCHLRSGHHVRSSGATTQGNCDYVVATVSRGSIHDFPDGIGSRCWSLSKFSVWTSLSIPLSVAAIQINKR